MYPKLSQRTTASGEVIYSYVCKMKERSKRERCNRRNANQFFFIFISAYEIEISSSEVYAYKFIERIGFGCRSFGFLYGSGFGNV